MYHELFDVLLDNVPDGIYVLDDSGHYIYANTVYIQLINMTKSALIGYDVHDFLRNKQINICISDIVYREKRRVAMFQDYYDKNDPTRKLHRQLIISSPIFNEAGEVSNIIAIVRKLDTMNDYYHQASMSELSSSFTRPEKNVDVDIIAESPAMLELLETSRTIAGVDSTVLITGESGTGKEVIAQYIHNNGPRAKKRTVVINCASLPPNLLEAELFGYEKGAFTGASASGSIGHIEEADGSTLFLDEVNSLPLALQGKLLRAIETKCIQRIGSTKTRHVDFRLIAATNENLHDLVSEKRFRVDLFYRLNVISLIVLPLRERRDDILPLTLHFLNHYCNKYNKNKLFSEKTLNLIREYDWPGNIRELKNFVERCVVMSMGDYIEVKNIQGIVADVNSINSGAGRSMTQENYKYEKMLKDGISLDDHIAECESAYLKYALDSYKSSYLVAEMLGTSQSSVMRRKKKYNI